MNQYRWPPNRTWSLRVRPVRKAAQQMNFSIVDQTKIVTAASELARNALVYGGGGVSNGKLSVENGRQGLRLTISDHGPGIEDLTLAMKDGWTSGRGFGIGTSGRQTTGERFYDNISARSRDNRNCDEMEMNQTQFSMIASSANLDPYYRPELDRSRRAECLR